jgi:hypothetical protein
MTRIGSIMLGAALAVCGACSHNHDRDTTPQQAKVDDDAPHGDRDAWDKAWDGIEQAGDETVDAGQWVFHKAEDGAVTVAHGTKKVAGKAGEEITDAAILSAVKSQLAAWDKTDASDIDVDVDEGVVTLEGTVDSREEAREAVRIAIETDGVDQVVSRLKVQGSMPAM